MAEVPVAGGGEVGNLDTMRVYAAVRAVTLAVSCAMVDVSDAFDSTS